MTGTPTRRRHTSAAAAGAAALALALAAAGCSSSAGSAAAWPAAAPIQPPAAVTGSAVAGAGAASGSAADCDPAALSPAPDSADAASAQVRKIKDRGRLVVGVAPDENLTGYLDGSGQEVGFDVDIARQVEKALFGTTDAQHIEFRAVTLPERISDLENGTVDMVVDTMTITCARAQQVDFSSVYYEAQQRLLVESDSGIRSLADLGPKDRVCVQEGSTNVGVVTGSPTHPGVYGVENLTDCLVALQQGQVQAVSTDDVILAGLAAQDPTTEVVGPPIAAEPYGIAVALHADQLAGFINGVLAQIRSNGVWEQIYDNWLGAKLGPAQPPAAQYR